MSTPSRKADLTLERVRAGYGRTIVLDGVSLDLRGGATLAVLGRNGVGKTTLLSTIMGHTTLHGGSIRFRGEDITTLRALPPCRVVCPMMVDSVADPVTAQHCQGGAPPKRSARPHHGTRHLLGVRGEDITTLPAYGRCRGGIGFVPQEREIFPSLTLEENLTVAARPGRWTLARVYDFFPRLAERRRNRGNQLSGGEQQMLAIGRALMGNPVLLLMDEPLEGLAPVIVDALLAGLDRLKREDVLALLLVEQNARLALALAEHAIILERGVVVHSGPSRALLDAPELLASLIGAGRH